MVIANIYTMHAVCQVLEMCISFFLTVPCHHYYCNPYFTNDKMPDSGCENNFLQLQGFWVQLLCHGAYLHIRSKIDLSHRISTTSLCHLMSLAPAAPSVCPFPTFTAEMLFTQRCSSFLSFHLSFYVNITLLKVLSWPHWLK